MRHGIGAENHLARADGRQRVLPRTLAAETAAPFQKHILVPFAQDFGFRPARRAAAAVGKEE